MNGCKIAAGGCVVPPRPPVEFTIPIDTTAPKELMDKARHAFWTGKGTKMPGPPITAQYMWDAGVVFQAIESGARLITDGRQLYVKESGFDIGRQKPYETWTHLGSCAKVLSLQLPKTLPATLPGADSFA